MREVLLNTYVSCTCASCGKTYERQAYRISKTSVTEQDAYRKYLEQGVCPDCAKRIHAEQARKDYERRSHERHLLKLARRRTVADIIQEYNIRHKEDKKGKHHI